MNMAALVGTALLAFGLYSTTAASADEAPVRAHDMPGMEDMPAMDAIAGDSLYQLPMMLTSAEGRTFKLAELRGRPLLTTMFYSHCTSVCPLLTAQLQHLTRQLAPAERHQVRVLMVSFDTARDTPEVLRAFKAEHHIQGANWLITRAPASDVRALAAALGIQYRELADHSFNHSAVLSVTDREGTVRARTSQLSGSDASFLAAVRAQLAVADAKP